MASGLSVNERKHLYPLRKQSELVECGAEAMQIGRDASLASLLGNDEVCVIELPENALQCAPDLLDEISIAHGFDSRLEWAA